MRLKKHTFTEKKKVGGGGFKVQPCGLCDA